MKNKKPKNIGHLGSIPKFEGKPLKHDEIPKPPKGKFTNSPKNNKNNKKK